MAGLDKTISNTAHGVADLKLQLEKLLRDNLDQFELLSQADRFGVDLTQTFSFSKQKFLVQKAVLDELLKCGDENKEYYSRLLVETKQNLDKKLSSDYLCCMVGCLFRTEKHRNYLAHLKKVHTTNDRLVCNFMHQCARQFTSFNLLVDHVREIHSNIHSGMSRNLLPELSVEIPCRCDMSSCGGRKFNNIPELMSHINNYHFQEERACIFENCGTRFNRGSNSRHHFNLKHKKLGQLNLKMKHLEHPTAFESTPRDGSSSRDQTININREEGMEELYAEEDFARIEDDSVLEDDDEEDDYFLMQYANFYNKLCHFKFIPYSTVQDIAKEYLEQSLKSSQCRERKLRDSLKKIPNISDDDIERVVNEVIGEDRLLKAQQELNTEHKRTKFIQTRFKFVAPVEIVLNKGEVRLGARKEVVHYVPIKESFKNLLEDTSLNVVLENERDRIHQKKGILADILDGAAVRENAFFKSNPGAYAGLFYSDGVELANPLGASRGKHKIVQMFYTLCQVPREQRSKIDRMQLVMVFKEKNIKKHGISQILKPLVRDLQELERGISLSYPMRREVQLGVLAFSADNLEAHQMGGFSCNFSSKDVCRWCHIQHHELVTQIHDSAGTTKHRYWNIAEYDRICDTLEEDEVPEHEEPPEDSPEESVVSETNLFNEIEEEDNEDLNDTQESEDEDGSNDENGSDDENQSNDEDEEQTNSGYGLRMRCPLNTLQAFHAVLSFPPDCMHDLMEGVIAYDLNAIVKIMIKKGWFSLKEYNEKMKKVGFFSYEASDKPYDVPEKSKKLTGKACSLWVHMRNFPLILQHFVNNVDEGEDVFILAMKLLDITNRMTAVEFRTHEIDTLEELIVNYLDIRKGLCERYPKLLVKPRPKHHFLVHYGQAIRLFGPPLSFWTARFESKHR